MDIYKIAFILCVNEEQEFKEALSYIEALNIPEGYQTDVIAVRDAPSMAAGYNAAMKESDAKYKIYLHQDVFLIYRDLLKDLIAVFESDENIGMAGVLGCRVMPQNAHAIARWDTGRTLGNSNPPYFLRYQDKKGHTATDVMAIDGMFMATQYDITWREDLFDAWDFYDISQSCEFIRSGKRVVIPYQQEYWVFHDNRMSNLTRYDAYRLKFIAEYQDIYPFRAEEADFEKRREYEQIKVEARRDLEALIDAGRMDEVCQLLMLPENAGVFMLRELELISRIYTSEKSLKLSRMIYDNGMSYQQVYSRFQHVRHLIKRVEFEHGNFAENAAELMRDYSICAIATVILAYGVRRKTVYDRLLSAYEKYDRKQYQELWQYGNLFKDNEICERKDMSEAEKRCFIIVKLSDGEKGDKQIEKLLFQYDKADNMIFTELPFGKECGIVFKNAGHLYGNIVNLISEQQDKLYSDYREVHIYGSEMEEYVKLYHDADVSVIWYAEDGYTGSVSYSDNIRVQSVSV